MTSLTLCFPPLKCQMIVCPSSLHSCVIGTNFPPSEPPDEIMSLGMSPENYSDSDSAVIPNTIVQVINALERDTVYRFGWKLFRNLENVPLFVKCKFPAKADDAKVDFLHHVNSRKKKKKPSSQ